MYKLFFTVAVLLCGTSFSDESALSACPDKFIAASRIGGNVCDTLTVKKDTDYLIFHVSFKIAPGPDMYDSAHMAAYKQYNHDLFTNFEIHSVTDTSRLGVPEKSDIATGYVLISKAEAYKVVEASYVTRLEYMDQLPYTVTSNQQQVFHSPTLGWHGRVDVMGRQQQKSLPWAGLAFLK